MELSNYVKIFFLSMLPITELRLSVPIGYFEYEMGLPGLLLASIAGNFLICVPVLYLISTIEKTFLKNELGERFLNYIYKRTRSKTKIIQKYKYLGIILFVGIPLPLTGAWTGCLASHLFGFSKKKTLVAVILGLIISSILMTLIVLFFKNILIYTGYEI